MNKLKPELYLKTMRDILGQRRIKNARYSVRALARDLEMDNAYLTHILNGKKKVTPRVAYKIAKTMKLEGKELLEFLIPSLTE